MNRLLLRFALVSLALVTLSGVRASTNGDNLLGVGATARALGGIGVAAPQDVLGAISGNPAALSYLATDLPSEYDASLTFFVPHVSARVGTLAADSAGKTYLIPSLGVSGPLGARGGPWQYGFAAYGVSGLGVDYRHTAIDTTLGPTPYPLVAGGRTELQILEVAPSLAYKISSAWSLGAALDVDYGRLNLGGPTKNGFGVGVRAGVVFKPSEQVSLGATYGSGKPITYKGVTDFDGDGSADNLKLEAPQQIAVGVAYELVPGRLLVATDARWVNWGGAKGYKDFDWQDSWVYGVGVQFDAIPKQLVLRAGYTFGDNPVKTHNNFNGTGGPANVTNVQGQYVNNYYYETFRVVGFPAVVEQHLSIGLGYRLGAHATIDVGYTHAFKNTISEQGTNLLGAPTTLSSSLSEDSFELGFKYQF
jgi:long-chain fatty acid transport protein